MVKENARGDARKDAKGNVETNMPEEKPEETTTITPPRGRTETCGSGAETRGEQCAYALYHTHHDREDERLDGGGTTTTGIRSWMCGVPLWNGRPRMPTTSRRSQTIGTMERG